MTLRPPVREVAPDAYFATFSFYSQHGVIRICGATSPWRVRNAAARWAWRWVPTFAGLVGLHARRCGSTRIVNTPHGYRCLDHLDAP